MEAQSRYDIDVAPDLYEYVRNWWGLQQARLTPKKCELLAKSISKWRRCYHDTNYRQLARMYQDDGELLGYLVGFGPRYAYTLYFLLKVCQKKQRICKKNDILRVCFLGGGAAIDLIGLLAYLYELGTPPRDIEAHFVDRSPQWRRFHNTLFGAILPRYFPKTRSLPYYHDIDLADPAPRYDASILRVFASTIFVLSNVLSEFTSEDSIREHMRILMRSAKQPFYLVVADSNAKKLRPRLSWVSDFVRNLGFPYYVQYCGSYEVDCNWLQQDRTTQSIFQSGSPSFQRTVKRWGFVARVIADAKGKNLTAK